MRAVPLQTLLDQQLWFLGGDIRHPEGNGLQRFGFTRWAASNGVGTSCYVYPRTTTAPIDALVCWGFAVYSGPVGFDLMPIRPSHTRSPVGVGGTGVLLHRFSRTPQLVDGTLRLPIHQRQALPVGYPARRIDELDALHDGLIRMAAVFAQYERWCSTVLGASHRRQGLALLPRHKRKRFADTIELTAAWERLRDRLETAVERPVISVLDLPDGSRRLR